MAANSLCLICSRNERTELSDMFERETKREKVLEAKNREMRLKNRAGGFISVFSNHKKSSGTEKKENLEAVEDPIAKAEKEFYEIVNKVIKY